MPDDNQEEDMMELVEQAQQMQDDDTVDFESKQRQADGWLKFYVECPDCEVPMARTTTQSQSVDAPEDEDREKVIMHAVCPDCGAKETLLTIYKTTKPVGFDSHFEAP